MHEQMINHGDFIPSLWKTAFFGLFRYQNTWPVEFLARIRRQGCSSAERRESADDETLKFHNRHTHIFKLYRNFCSSCAWSFGVALSVEPCNTVEPVESEEDRKKALQSICGSESVG